MSRLPPPKSTLLAVATDQTTAGSQSTQFSLQNRVFTAAVRRLFAEIFNFQNPYSSCCTRPRVARREIFPTLPGENDAFRSELALNSCTTAKYAFFHGARIFFSEFLRRFFTEKKRFEKCFPRAAFRVSPRGPSREQRPAFVRLHTRRQTPATRAFRHPFLPFLG